MIYTSIDVVAYLPWYLGPVEELALSFVGMLYTLVTTFTFALLLPTMHHLPLWADIVFPGRD